MQFQFSFKHMESSPALQEYAQMKVTEKIQKFVTKPIEAHLTFSVEKIQHRAHCSFRAGDGFHVEVEHSCGDMYGSVDQLIDKLETQLKRHKEKLKDHKQRHSVRQMAAPEIPEETVEADEVIRLEEARKRAEG